MPIEWIVDITMVVRPRPTLPPLPRHIVPHRSPDVRVLVLWFAWRSPDVLKRRTFGYRLPTYPPPDVRVGGIMSANLKCNFEQKKNSRDERKNPFIAIAVLGPRLRKEKRQKMCEISM